MYSIILAGGFGKRLGKITKKVPKPLLKIGKKPFIFYLLDSLEKHGFKYAIICVHYLKKQFKDIFSSLDLKVNTVNFDKDEFKNEIKLDYNKDVFGNLSSLLKCFKIAFIIFGVCKISSSFIYRRKCFILFFEYPYRS